MVQPVRELRHHLPVPAVPAPEQPQRQHEVHHQPRRQQPPPLLPRPGILHRRIHQLRRENPGQHPDRDPVRQPAVRREPFRTIMCHETVTIPDKVLTQGHWAVCLAGNCITGTFCSTISPRCRNWLPQRRESSGLPGLDMIETPWLHMTTYIVGFADEVAVSAVEKMISNASRLLSEVPPVGISLGRVGYATQAIALPAEPPGILNPVLDAVREATRTAGCQGHTDTAPWLPHISIAYSNASIPTAPIISALGRWLPRIEITIRSISLVSQTQVGRSWQWRPVAEIFLAETRDGIARVPADGYMAYPCRRVWRHKVRDATDPR